MENKTNGLKKILSFITYKETAKVKEFFIPEVNEKGKEVSQDIRQTVDTDQSVNEPSKVNKKSKGIKIPKTADEIKEEKVNSRVVSADTGVSKNIQANIDFLKKKFNYPDNKDIILREFTIAGEHKALLAYLDGMADRTTINNSILRPLLTSEKMSLNQEHFCQLDFILNHVIETHQAVKSVDPNEVMYGILSGDTGLYVDGCDFYILCDTKGYEKRAVDKPHAENVVKGSQEAFNENLRTNISLLRRIIKNNNFTTEIMKVGEQNQNSCAVTYIKGLVNPAIVTEVKRRINGLRTDFILGDGILEQFIEDNPWTLFPTILSTERPDRTASHMLEGKVAILTEGTPYALIVPVTLAALLHTPEDYNLKWQHGIMLRSIRLFAVFVAALLPGLYVALTNFHREMIPTELLIAIAQARENVPFPSIVEILLMELSFELIREAGIRVPGIIGNTIGIIGALILGQAAVQANLVSPVMIIVIAFTGMGNFAIPDVNLALAVRIQRLIFIVAGAFLGFYGISLVIVAIMSILVNIKSFGVLFFSVFSPKTRKSHDAFLRRPIWKQEFRPDVINPLNVRRQPKVSRQWTQENPETGYEQEDENDKGR